MHRTKNDLPEPIRARIVELCNARLADAVDFQSQCKQAHWNVRGPSFRQLHELFDDVNEDAEAYVDLVAERVVQLGGDAMGTARIVAQRSGLPEYPRNAASGREHVEALSTAIAAFGRAARQAIDVAAEARDADTADIFTEISRGLDKWLWMVEAHVQADR